MFLKLVFAYCISVLFNNVQDTGMSLLHSSLSPLLAEAKITHMFVVLLLNAAVRLSVPSQILFSITCGFVATH
jgi:hypothetical protein